MRKTLTTTKNVPAFVTFRFGHTLFKSAIDDFLDSLQGENRHLLKSLVTENFQLFEIPKT